LTVAKRRQNEGQFDAVLADTIRVADTFSPEPARQNYLVEGVFFDYLTLGDGQPTLARATLQGCVIETIDISNLERPDDCPSFQDCLIGHVEGATAIPKEFASKFTNCEIGGYSDQLQTTAGIMQLKMPAKLRISLTILKKIYSQRGTGRKEGALSRGLSPQLRPLVPEVIEDLMKYGWITASSSRGESIYLPVKNRRTQALKALDKPGDFRLDR